MMKQEIRASLASLPAPGPAPDPAPGPAPGPSPPKKRRLQSTPSDQEDADSTSEGPDEGFPSGGSDQSFLFHSEELGDLIGAVRSTMGLEEVQSLPSIQDKMFAGLKSVKQLGFPVHANVLDIVSQEWEFPERRVRSDLKRRFPLEPSGLHWEVPRVDVQVARVAKQTALPFEDTSQLKDQMDRKVEGLMKRSWEASSSSIQANIASTCVSRSLIRWLDQLEAHISQGTPREELLESLPLLKKATCFLADTSVESVRLAARTSVLSNSARRALWLKAWSGDSTSKMRLCSLPFKGDLVFGPALDDILDKATDRKALPDPRPNRKRSFRPSMPQASQPRGKGKTGRWSYPKGRGRNILIPPHQQRPQQDKVTRPGWGGRLSAFLPQWQSITTCQWVLKIISDGLLIEFLSPPLPGLRVTALTSPGSQALLYTKIIELVHSGVVSPVPSREEGVGHYSRLFLVKKPSGDVRIIINLKRLNRQVRYRRFKMESVKSAIPLIGLHHQMASIDLKDAYFHVPVHPGHRQYLRFAVLHGEEVLHFQFNVLPFGISSAPRIFSKIMAEVVAFIRLQGICLVPYLDDFLLMAPSAPTLRSHVERSLGILRSLGWIPNLKKSQLTPSSTRQFLGVLLDSDRQASFLPEGHRIALLAKISKLCRQARPTLRAAMSALGSMTSCIPSVRWAQAHSRCLQDHILAHWDRLPSSLNRRFRLSESVSSSLLWWLSPANLQVGVAWTQKPLVTLTTDASLRGWGAMVANSPFQGVWSPYVSSQSSNYRELRAVREALLAAQDLVRDSHVLVYSDNITTVAHLRHQGSTRSGALKSVSSRIFQWAEQSLLSLSAVHLKGSLNLQADFLSRRDVHPGEWSLDQAVFCSLVARWGAPEVDLFASAGNRKVATYFSLNPRDEALGVDAFCHSWSFRLAYAFPPLPLLARALRKIRDEGVPTILVAPLWPRRSWYSLVMTLGIDGPVLLGSDPSLLSQGPIFHPAPQKLNLAAWLLRPGH
ncbi:heterogeneous nuclear ribonucleoproteins A2/B1 isoform 1-T1 [Anomaloglossus baeobatrachus]